MIKYTCNHNYVACTLIKCTCILNYTRMQGNYVYMQDNYVYMQDNYVYIITYFFTQVKMYIVQWNIYVVMYLHGHRTLPNLTSHVFDLTAHHKFMYYSDVIMSAMASHITTVSIISSTVCSGADQRKHQSFVSLAFVIGIYRWPVDSPHKGLVTRKIFLYHDFIMHNFGFSVCIKRVLVTCQLQQGSPLGVFFLGRI